MRAAIVVSAALIVAAVACTHDTTPPGPPTFPCEVEQILSNRCWKCHSNPPARGVPFPLKTWDDTRKTTSLTDSGKPAPIWNAMGEVLRENRMPLSDVTFMPDPLPQSEHDVMLGWLDKGAPAGDKCP